MLAVRGREDGLTEDVNFSEPSANATQEVWYAKNSDVVKDIVHQIYSKEPAYQKLKARIATSVQSMALTIPALTRGCDADTRSPSRRDEAASRRGGDRLNACARFAGGTDWIGRQEPCAVPQGKSSVRLSLSAPALAAQ